MKPEPKTDAHSTTTPARKVVPLHRGPTFQEDASALLADELRESCEAIATRHLTECIQALFDRADDTFFDLADKAENNAIQTLYFDAMRQLRLDRKHIEQRFIDGVHAGFHDNATDQAGATPPTLDNISLDDISLVEETDLEESLAINGMAAKARQRYSQALYALEQRLRHLTPSRALSIETLPAGPQTLCDAFRKALRAHDAELKIKLILYKLFDKHVMSALDPCYDDVNTFLVRAGVLPELKMQIRKVPGQSASSPDSPAPGTQGQTARASGAAALSEGGFTADAPAGDGADLLSTLQQLLAHAQHSQAGNTGQAGIASPGQGFAGGTAQTSASTAGLDAGIPTLHNGIQPAPPVLSALTGLQQQAVAPAGEGTDGGATLRAQLVAALGPEQATALRQVDNDLIDIVSLLFDFILEDDNLPAAAKALLARLQIPMLKVAMLDREFFSRKNHPARRLLNLMATACVGFDDATATRGADTGNVLDEVERVVNRILDDFNDDVALFETLLGEFTDWQARAAEQQDTVPETVSASFRRREEIALAKQWVIACVAEHLMGKPVPDTLHALITGPWTEVLLQTYLRHGEDSVLWLEQVRFVDILLWSVEPKQAPADRRKLAGVILSLVHTLRDGLEQAGCPEGDTQRIIDSLESYHMASLYGRDPDSTPAPSRADKALDDPDAVPLPSAESLETASEGDLDILISHMQAQLADLDRIEALLTDDDVQDEDRDAINPDHPNGEHTAALATEEDAPAPDYIEDIVLSGPDGSPEAPHLAPDDASLRLARELPVGAWLTFHTDSGETRRGRLAWKSDLLGQYTFVNWRYQVIADLSTQGLAAHLRRGSARPVDDIPLFDRAMSALVNGLKRTTNTTAPKPS